MNNCATQASALQRENAQPRNIMIFVLVMSLSGLADLIAETMPSLELGPIEVSISTFWFVPLTLCILFFGWWAALAAPIGELVFSDLLLGEFGGLGEIEAVVLVAIALYIAGWVVRDPKNRRQLIIAGLLSYFIAELAGTFIDIFKVWVGKVVRGREAIRAYRHLFLPDLEAAVFCSAEITLFAVFFCCNHPISTSQKSERD